MIALPLGILSAVKRNSLIDLISSAFASLGNAMPNFWLGLMLIIIFSVNLRILPAFGALEPAAIIMPAVTLAVGTAARRWQWVQQRVYRASHGLLCSKS